MKLVIDPSIFIQCPWNFTFAQIFLP